MKSTLQILLFCLLTNLLFAQSKEQIISQLIDESSTMEVSAAINIINENFLNHSSSTEPYILHNAKIQLAESDKCKCSLQIDEYYMKLYSDEKRSIVYNLDLGELNLNHLWIEKGEIFQLKMDHQNEAEVKVFTNGTLVKELTTDIVEFATPINREDEMIMAFARLQKACYSNEIFMLQEKIPFSKTNGQEKKNLRN